MMATERMAGARAQASRRNGAKSRSPRVPQARRSPQIVLRPRPRAQICVLLGDEDADRRPFDLEKPNEPDMPIIADVAPNEPEPGRTLHEVRAARRLHEPAAAGVQTNPKPAGFLVSDRQEDAKEPEQTGRGRDRRYAWPGN